MSKVIACPKCGGPMDVPAYPGDGVYRTHWCPEPWSAVESRQRERMQTRDFNMDEAEEW